MGGFQPIHWMNGSRSNLQKYYKRKFKYCQEKICNIKQFGFLIVSILRARLLRRQDMV